MNVMHNILFEFTIKIYC